MGLWEMNREENAVSGKMSKFSLRLPGSTYLDERFLKKNEQNKDVRM